MKFLKLMSIFIITSLIACSESEFTALHDSSDLFSKSFTQVGKSKKIDLLVVVDNSVSMRKDLDKLSVEFLSFIESLQEADYQIGVITTDVASSGKEFEPGFYGNLDRVEQTNKIYISKADANQEDLFKDLITREESVNCVESNPQPGDKICPSGRERPLTAIRMAIEKKDTLNQGFFREGAELGVVIITDEDETKIDNTEDYFTSGDLVHFFNSEFSNTKSMNAFTLSILEGDQACYDQQKAEIQNPNENATSYGVIVGELASLVGGFNSSICEEDYSNILKKISKHVEKNLLPFREKVPATIRKNTISLEITTPDGKAFEADYILKDGFIEISPAPPVGSIIKLEYKY